MFVTAGGILFLFRSSPHHWTAGGKLKEKTLGAKYRMFGLSPFIERLSLTGCTLVAWHHNTKRLWTISMYTVSHYLFPFHRLLHSNAIKKIDVRAFAGLHGLRSLWVLYYNWINFLVVGSRPKPYYIFNFILSFLSYLRRKKGRIKLFCLFVVDPNFYRLTYFMLFFFFVSLSSHR